jgi:WhiB family redox-sensing transcriptional regulator
VCAGCPVRERCLDYAIEHVEIGVWGGTSERERRGMRRTRRMAQAS